MGSGDVRAEDQLLRIVYDELRRIAASKLAHERAGHTLQTTALVNEAYIRLLGNQPAPSESISTSNDSADSNTDRWNSRGHFFASAAEAMRRILIDNARRKKRLKRGGDKKNISLDDVDFEIAAPDDVDLEQLDLLLTKLEETNPQHAAIVKLRYFAGMTIEQVADSLGISTATVKRSWAYSRVWLKREMGE